MSKVDAQRALREAKYARDTASKPSRRGAAAVGGTPTVSDPSTPAVKPARVTKAAAAADGERCGHKSMNGRACTREAAHSEKSHRYG